ncbi:T9SS type A sorting domain-containing protein [Lewinella sp. IMCC34191]|uniref:T9SS type A sorting domain-containing protein n=1 Tax=Lewinella sp. IMCC34191 TaxID=2259172 RepID=UPI000E2501C8|nr:T9SS type A sorting domain-containing protein [Lewinella sp. IMCC34191]
MIISYSTIRVTLSIVLLIHLPTFLQAQSFSEFRTIEFPNSDEPAYSTFYLQDINGDGKEDLITDGIAVRLQQDEYFGRATYFGKAPHATFLGELMEGTAPGMVFVTSDRWAQPGPADSVFYLPNHILTEAGTPTLIEALPTDLSTKVSVKDIDRDGVQELVYLQNPLDDRLATPVVRILRVDWSTGEVLDSSQTALSAIREGMTSMHALQDYDGDGDLDYLIQSNRSVYLAEYDREAASFLPARKILQSDTGYGNMKPLRLKDGTFEFWVMQDYGQYNILRLGTHPTDTASYQINGKFKSSYLPYKPDALQRAYTFEDLDADGDLDILTAAYQGYNTDVVSVRLQHESGQFIPAERFELPDQSGISKLVRYSGSYYIAHLGEEKLTLCTSESTQSADERKAKVPVYGDDTGFSYAIANLDNQGTDELLMYRDRMLSVWRRDAQSKLWRTEPILLDSIGGQAPSIAFYQLIDYDRDGYQDLLLQDRVPPSTFEGGVARFYYLKNEGGRFSTTLRNLEIPAHLIGARIVEVADFDGNGKWDYRTEGRNSSGTISQIHYQLSDGTFATIAENDIGADIENRRFVDVTGDGMVDLIAHPKVNNSTLRRVYVYVATAPGTFREEPVILGSDSEYFLGDQDANGIMEIYYWQRPEIYTKKFYHRAEFDPSTEEFSITANVFEWSGSVIAVRDYDGDGVRDYISTNGRYYLQYLPGDTRDEWKKIDISSGGTSLTASTRVGNFNDDDQLDFVVRHGAARFGYDYLGYHDLFYLSKPANGYEAGLNIYSGDNTFAYAFADFNGDGIADCLMYTPFGLDVQINEGRFDPGAPAYRLLANFTGKTYNSELSVDIRDLNNNGRPDVLAHFGDGEIGTIAEFRPDGQSIHSTFYHTSNLPRDYVDYNGDHKPDIVGGFRNAIASKRNISTVDSFGFESDGHVLYELPDDLYGRVTDIAADFRKQDEVWNIVLVASQKLYLLSKLGSGPVQVTPMFSTETINKNGLRKADFDGDGRMEFLVEVQRGYDYWSYIFEPNNQAPEALRLLSAGTVRDYTFKDADADGDLDAIQHDGVLLNNNDGATFKVQKLPTVFNRSYYNLDGNEVIDAVGPDYVHFDLPPGSEEYIGKELPYRNELSSHSYNVRTADMDADGVRDLIFYPPGDGTKMPVWTLKGGLKGEFGVSYDEAIQLPHLPAGSTINAVADFDGDGFSDLHAVLGDQEYANALSRSDALILGNPNLELPDRFHALKLSGSRTIDWEGDGDPDLVWQGGAMINEFNSEKTFSYRPIEGLEIEDRYEYGDVNQDGRPDVVRISEKDGAGNTHPDSLYVWWQQQSTTGHLLPARILFSTDQCISCSRLVIKDFDGDDDNDIVLISTVSGPVNTMYYVEALANQRWGAPRKFLSEQHGRYAFGNLDQNEFTDLAILDVLSSGWDNPDTLHSYLDIARPHSNRISRVTGPSTTQEIRLVDLNADGADDILAIEFGANGVRYALNQINAPTLKARVYIATEYDQPFTEASIPLRNIPIRIKESGNLYLTQADGTVAIPARQGNYTVEWVDHPLWELHQSVSEYDIAAESSSAGEATFAARAIKEIVDYQPSITSDPTRCGFSPNIYYTFTNTGTVPGEKVNYSIQIPEAVQKVVEMTPLPATVDGNTYTFSADSWQPTESKQVVARLQMPGVSYIGRRIPFAASVTPQEGQTFADTMWSKISCAYDPNDKLAHPDRGGEHSYILFEEWINYTIRFQNTGNDTAFTVRITDQIDTSVLDLSTFEFLQSSHDCKVTVDAEGMLSFQFDDILLPDSTTNEPLSHGLVQFRIRTHQNLAENTKLENKANIYFDFNPPIITDAVVNTLVTELPKTTSIFHDTEDHPVKVYPNPAYSAFTIEVPADNASGTAPLSFVLYNGLGQQVIPAQPIRNPIRTDHLPAGPYLLQLRYASGQTKTAKLTIVR